MTERTLELSELSHQKLALLASGLEQDRDELVNALRDLSDMYVFAWDRVDGDLVMFSTTIPRFEAAHEKAKAILAKYRVSA